MKTLPIDVLDLCVHDLIQRNERLVSFVQIGGHDGVTLDPIRPYVMAHGWRGVIVEPQPEMFKKLSENYDRIDGVTLENCLITDQDGEREFFMFAPSQSLPYHATMLASLNRDALVHNGHGYKGEVVSIKVPALSPASLLKKHGIRTVDLLQIDTEGHDAVIIQGFFRAAVFPTLIHFESALCGVPNELAEHGYRINTMGIDTIAYRQGETGSFQERVPFSGL